MSAKNFSIQAGCDRITFPSLYLFRGPETLNRSDRAAMSDAFPFAPELYDFRPEYDPTAVGSSTIGPRHDVYGLEIFGIRMESDTTLILELLTARRQFRSYPTMIQSTTTATSPSRTGNLPC